ncbi:RluA family pseudouridine synthase [Oceanobacillus halotolerans]|uniref:RluA family pseudouridine synthase n=1 Tax=Oceanobacillus halotolerans TaxID=2663380 RepID=UPI0013DAEC0C|nr:RluA family pseudouridine synthase [Oceanobacillus halotolerans]
MNIPVLYEDNHLLVVEKPVNIPVQEDITKDPDLLSILKEDIKKRYQKPGNVFLALVHRLDRPVGGAMVFAKTSKAASRLSDSMRRGKFDKSYMAVVRGEPQAEQATLEHYLWKDRSKNKVYAVSPQYKQAKKAKLAYKVVDQTKQFSLLEIQLYTGRPHQIRVQLSETGCPLYGDQKYGQGLNKHGQQIALWANELSFEHPTKKDIITVHSTPPSEYPWEQFDVLDG